MDFINIDLNIDVTPRSQPAALVQGFVLSVRTLKFYSIFYVQLNIDRLHSIFEI